MSLQRSVEAGTSEEALQLALEQYGPGTEITEVRTIRTGGFLGFFTAERVRVMIGDSTAGPKSEPTERTIVDVDEVAALFGMASPALDAGTDPKLYSRPTTPAAYPKVDVSARAHETVWAVDENALPAVSDPAVPRSPFAAALARVTNRDPALTAALERSARTITAPSAALALTAEPEPVPTPTVNVVADPPATPATLPERTLSAQELNPGTTTGMGAALAALGLPEMLVTPALLASIADRGPHSAFRWLFRQRIASAPVLPTEAGQVLLVVGSGEEALKGARQVAPLLGVDPRKILLTSASPDLLGRVTPRQRVQSVTEAAVRAARIKTGPVPVIVAVDAPMSAGHTTANELIAAWDPDGVWAVVDATRRAADLTRWLDGFTIVDALIGHTVGASTAPAELLATGIPVAILDGDQATPKRWASLLCECLDWDGDE